MPHDITPYVVHEQLIEDHRTDGLRSGEGAVLPLKDGTLLMLYGRFEGPRDGDRTTLVTRRSTDGGVTWSDAEIFAETPEGAWNLMSISFLRLADGRAAMLYLRKNSMDDLQPYFLTSDDEGERWSEPVRACDREAYFVVNNDRLVQLSSGRLLIPFCRHDMNAEDRMRGYCGCFISDDTGATWRSGSELRIEPENVRRPDEMLDTPENDAFFAKGEIAGQEPGVLELLDGRVFMWCRSNGGYAYRAVSDDGGETWGPFEAIPEFPMPCGPQSIVRLPESERVVMLYNDRTGVPFGDRQFQWRRPLAVAVSDDDCATWKRHGLLESDRLPTQCYYSICAHGENMVFTYYEGIMQTAGNGLYVPSNLKSLKLKVVRREYFEL